MTGRELTAVSCVFIVSVLMPITVGIVLRLLRGPVRGAQPIADPASGARLDRLEQSMDAIAIEIERISEGQRFITRILTERPSPALSAQSLPAQHERQALRQSITPH